ncbi:MAG: PVC-type heme-binding CxxCH protein [Pirellulales bacterium]
MIVKLSRLICVAAFVIAASGFASSLRGAAQPVSWTYTARLNGHNFTLPRGFIIEQVAGPPLVDRPIVADFDEQGRLYVADSSGSNEKVEVQLAKKPHRIVRLEDTDGDGRFDKSTVFADQMMFPEGTMWYRGSLYVAAPPSIWKLTDTDDDGVADERVEWFAGKTLTGCANDLHGPYLGRDGWIYWAKGAFAKQTYERPGRAPLVTRASHIFRARPDGTGIEPVMTGGMDNPVDVVFTPKGERIFSCTFFQHPGGGQRDGLIHAIYGGVYGKDHDVIHEHVWTSPDLLPVLSQLGPAAPCGLALYESKSFGEDYQHNVFTALFNLRKITRHVLLPDGATYRTRDEDFLVSDNLDFHPTDVFEDADGSLLVIDTGGWYKLCCPTSQLDKPDVLGAIYRIRRDGAAKVADPRGQTLNWSELPPGSLVELLGDARPAVQRRAIETLADLGDKAVSALDHELSQSASTVARRNAVWAAVRIDTGERIVRKALADSDPTVRQTAAHAVAVRRDRAAREPLIRMLQEPLPHSRRVAAEALGRIGDPTAIPALLTCLAEAADRALEHSLTYALIEIGAEQPLVAALASDNVRVRRAALVALDQMKSPRLPAAAVLSELESEAEPLRLTAWWIAGRHPEWGDQLAGLLRIKLLDEADSEKREAFVRHAAELAKSATVQRMLSDLVANPGTPDAAVQAALAAMSQARLKDLPDTWVDALVARTRQRGSSLDETLACIRRLKIPAAKATALIAELVAVANDESLARKFRVLALAAAPAKVGKVSTAVFDKVTASLAPEQPTDERLDAAEALARASLDKPQLLHLCRIIEQAGPLEVERLLPVFAKTDDDEVGLSLIAALSGNSARDNLRADMLLPVVQKCGETVRRAAAGLIAEINKDYEQQRAELEQLLARLPTGDVRRGQAIFHNAKTACFACHAIGYVGGRTGPDLTAIGKVRSDRDLLESIIFPSISLVQSYESAVVVTKDGRSHNGLIHGETADEIVLATGPNQELRLARTDIEEQQPSKISIMPAGLDKQLTEQELGDLLAFLKSRR